MSDYWYTDEYGRKRHVGGDSSEGYSVVPKHHYYAINSIFSSYSSHFSRSRLHSTHCPVCSADVFFCECDNGGRVFFDSLAPTWKKHPCTTSYESGNRVKTYHLIYPKENHFIKNGENTSKKTVIDVPDFMNRFELNLNNTRAYANLVDNCTILVRQNNGKLLLTILVNNKKFKNEYLCRDKEFERQRELEEFLESVMWNTDLTESLKIKKKENKIKTVGEHKIIQINKQNVGKVLTTLTEQQNKIKNQKYFEEKQREAVHKERQDRHRGDNKASQNEQKFNPTIPKRESLSIVKKKNVLEKPIVPVATPRDDSKISLDQFGSTKEALRAIKDKLQKQLDEKNA
jgi:hypothetical protein